MPSDSVERAWPQFSPDGKELAFIESRNRLMVLNLASGQVRQITDGSTWYDTGGSFAYAWSPDGKWFTLEFIGNRHDPYTDIGLVSAQGGGEIFNLTNSGYTSGLCSTAMPSFSLPSVTVCVHTPRGVRRTMPCWYSSTRMLTTNTA